MSPYRVFIAATVIADLRKCPRRERILITRFFEEPASNPCRAGDYVEPDDIGRPIQVLIVGRHALFFWPDHAVKEVKILDLKVAGN